MAISRNNPSSKNKKPLYKTAASGKTVRPCLYVGKYAGHGRYMAAQIDDQPGVTQLVCDPDGKPYAYRDIDSSFLRDL